MKLHSISGAILAFVFTVGLFASCDSSSSTSSDPKTPADTLPATSAGMVSPSTFSPVAGAYATAQTVSIATATSGADIYYTTDGSTPTTSSTKYSVPVAVNSSLTLKAIAVKAGLTTSSVNAAAYTIQAGGNTTGTVVWNGQTYKTVKIGNQTWMAENLNYAGAAGTTGVCYNNSTDSCKKYGRLYTWSEAMAGGVASSAKPSGVQGICPTGWHVPSDTEWTILQNAAGADSIAGTKLKAKSGWIALNGTDVYGFAVLAAGSHYAIGGAFYDAGGQGYFWTTTQLNDTKAYYRGFTYTYEHVYQGSYDKANGFSLRCTQN